MKNCQKEAENQCLVTRQAVEHILVEEGQTLTITLMLGHIQAVEGLISAMGHSMKHIQE